MLQTVYTAVLRRLYPEKGPETSQALYTIDAFGAHLKEWCEGQEAVDGAKPKKNAKMQINNVPGAGWEHLVFNVSA